MTHTMTLRCLNESISNCEEFNAEEMVVGICVSTGVLAEMTGNQPDKKEAGFQIASLQLVPPS